MLHYSRAFVRTLTRSRIKSERGATAVEYGLMVVLIAAVIVGVVYLIGQNVLQGFTKVNTELDKTTP